MSVSFTGVVTLLLRGDGVWLAQRTAADRPFVGAHAAPGGSIEEGESPRDAAVREVIEETGLKLDPERFQYGSRSDHKYEDGTPFWMHWFYVKLNETEEPACVEPHKQGEWVLWPSWHLPIPMTPGTGHAIAEIAPLVEGRVAQLEAAIRNHRDQKGDDRCYLDDAALYAVLGEKTQAKTALPPIEVFLANCARYHQSRQCKTDYVAVDPKLDEAQAEIKKLRTSLANTAGKMLDAMAFKVARDVLREVTHEKAVEACQAEVRKRYAERRTRPEWAERLCSELEKLKTEVPRG